MCKQSDSHIINIQEGVFNNFSAQEFSQLNKKAKDHIIALIDGGELFDEAEAQKENLIELLQSIFEKTGWRLELKKEPTLYKG